MATDVEFGEDLGGVDDLDLYHDKVIGMDLLMQDVASRLTCPFGGVIDDPGYGVDLRSYLSAEAGPRTRAEVLNLVLSQIRQDERVEDISRVDVRFEGVGDTRKLIVDVDGVSARGPFSLTVGVSKARTEVLEGVAR